MANLWSQNTPEKFWLCTSPIPEREWQEAITRSIPLLGLVTKEIENIDKLLELTLGEGRFGSNHWELGLFKRLYYLLKPVLPRLLTRTLRRFYKNPLDTKNMLDWPVDSRYILFQWEVMRQLLLMTGREHIQYTPFWPNDYQFAFTLTHDIETVDGQSFVRKVADMEESFGFRSSFNFVLERYKLDHTLMRELSERGFEVGCHGLKHDGKLFSTRTEFMNRARRINARMKELNMIGFRTPLTHRNPEWMQELDIEYDLSFFDADPFEPIPGGTMSIWPFFIGRFVELPYTLVQDYSLTSILGETSPKIWLEKVDFIQRYKGLALINSHPDYLREKNTWNVYYEFLAAMKNRDGYWHALPREVADWWRERAHGGLLDSEHGRGPVAAFLKNGGLELGSCTA